MSYAVKGVTTERGLDVGDFVLVAYGGAGPLHAVEIARELGMRRVIIPRAPGVFSAYGMLFSDLRYDFVRSWFKRLDEASVRGNGEDLSASSRTRAGATIAATSVKPEEIVITRAADMRYVGQEHAVTVDLPMEVFEKKDREAIKEHFDAQHELRYGTCAPGGARRDRQPAHGRHRRDAQAAAGKGRSGRPRAAESCFHRRAAGLFTKAQASSTRRPMRAPSSSPATRSPARRWSKSMRRRRCWRPAIRLTVNAYGHLEIAVAGRK